MTIELTKKELDAVIVATGHTVTQIDLLKNNDADHKAMKHRKKLKSAYMKLCDCQFNMSIEEVLRGLLKLPKVEEAD
jgi:hypothetical protein